VTPADVKTIEQQKMEAFRSGLIPELFHPITHQHEIVHPDPYDVDVIHKHAREQFELLLQRVSDGEAHSGRILLLKGDSGAGKTHLMRVFRNQMHQDGLGYFAYMQMTSQVTNYPRYMLRRLLDSFDQAYFEHSGNTTALMRLSDALLDYASGKGVVSAIELQEVRDEWIDPTRLTELVFELSERIITVLGRDVTRYLNLVRAFLYLQPRVPGTSSRVFAFLRCDPLTPFDSQALGGMSVTQDEEEPMTRLRSLAHLIRILNGGGLVVCLDQLEDINQVDDSGPRFRRAMQAAVQLAEEPNVLVILACLKEHYDLLSRSLIPPQKDRIEKDPEPVELIASRTLEEISLLVAKRLAGLYASADLETSENHDTYPFSERALSQLAGQRTRDVLDWCRKQRDTARGNGPFTEPEEDLPAQSEAAKDFTELDQLWNDFKTEFSQPVPQDTELLGLFGDSITRCAAELKSGHSFKVQVVGTFTNVDVLNAVGEGEQRLRLGLCNQKAQGGGLARRLEDLELGASGRVPVAIRSVEFPSNPTTVIAKKLGQFITRGGRRVVAQDSELNDLNAFRAFQDKHHGRPDFQRWLVHARPLTQLNCLREILNLEKLKESAIATSTTSLASAISTTPESSALTALAMPVREANVGNTQRLRLGIRIGLQSDPHFLNPKDLMRHAAFLGGTGSGKTTLALTCIEQLLLSGVPAILVDRKGDLCSYARAAAWNSVNDTAERKERRARLREAIEVAVYTPGTLPGTGRPLSIPIAPDGLGQLSSAERTQFANFSARSLGGLLSYKETPNDEQKVAILGQAIAVLSGLGKPVTIDTLIEIIDNADPALVNAIGKLDSKHFKDIVERLQTLKLLRGSLFLEDAERLSAEALLGIGPATNGRTRLSIINTSALGDGSIYWVAQFLLEISRYAVRNPKSQLQAIVMFDEADQYLPAQSKPATKAPLESLLKRARAAGIGLMLATQSPGDLDYKSRDQILSWFVGRITQDTAIKKLEPLFSETKLDPMAKLGGQQSGQFFAICGQDVVQIKADMSLVRAEPLSSQEIMDVAAAAKI